MGGVMADYTIKRGDTTPTFAATITDITGTPVNLTGATVTFVARALTAISPSINAAATLVTPASGAVSYAPTVNDTAAAGMYMVEWHYTLAGGGKGTFPVDGWLELAVEEDIVTPGGQRIVGLGEVKDHLRIPLADHTHDNRLTQMIDNLTPVVENLAGPILQRVYTNESYDGGQWFITLRHRPVISIASVIEYRGPIPYPLTQVSSPDLGSIYSYMFKPPGRIVRRTVGGGITPFPPGADQVAVTYTAGQLSTPPNVREGMLELIRVNYQPTEQGIRQGIAGSNTADDELSATQMMGFLIPGRVRELLAPNRRHPSVA